MFRGNTIACRVPCWKIKSYIYALLAVEEFFFEEMNRVFRFKAGELPDYWSITGKGEAEITVAPFSTEAKDLTLINGIREYLKLWGK